MEENRARVLFVDSTRANTKRLSNRFGGGGGGRNRTYSAVIRSKREFIVPICLINRIPIRLMDLNKRLWNAREEKRPLYNCTLPSILFGVLFGVKHLSMIVRRRVTLSLRVGCGFFEASREMQKDLFIGPLIGAIISLNYISKVAAVLLCYQVIVEIIFDVCEQSFFFFINNLSFEYKFPL